ncbi:MAG: translocation/assembly module TamB domain-containing protein [Polyangiaceae bacterium]
MSDTKSPEAAAPPKKPTKKRRALKIGGTILGIPLLLATLGVGYLHTGPGKAKIKGIVVDKLKERVNGSVEVGVVDYALFGDVKLGDVHLKDEAGVEGVGLSSLTISPSWGNLLHGNLVIDKVAVSGIGVHIVKDADGGSNLKRLFKPIPEDPNKKPLSRLVTVKSLTIGDVAVDILQPDGTKVLVSNVAVDGSLAILPANKDVDVEITKLGLSVGIDKGENKLKLGVNGVETGITVKLEKGAGKATLHPLKGRVALTLPERQERGFDIGLAGFSADIGENGVGVSLEKFLAGAVALASVEVKGRMSNGAIDGKQDADVLGLKVSGARVNELLGKPVLAGDIDVETHIHGPPDKIEINGKITTPGAAVDIDGSVGVADPTNPSYDVGVTLRDVDTDKLLAPEMGVSRVAVDSVKVTVKGQGPKVDTAGAIAKVNVSGVTARGVRMDGLDFEGELDKGVLKVKSVEVKGIGQKLTASGEVEIATKKIDLKVGVNGDVGDALARLRDAGLPIKSNLPRGAVVLPEGDLQVHAKGLLAGAIDVQVSAKKMTVLGGSVGLDAKASLIRHDPPLEDGKKVTVTAMDADVKIAGIKLSSILAMRGKKLKGMDGTLAGDIHVEGTPKEPRAKLMLGLATSREDKGKSLRLSISGDVNPTQADLNVALTPVDAQNKLLSLAAKLPLSMGGEKKGIDPYRALDVHADLPKTTFAEIWEYVPKDALPGIQFLPKGDVALGLDVKGTAAKPEGTLKLALTSHANFANLEQEQKVDLQATLKPTGNGTQLAAHTDLDLWLDSAKGKLVHVGGDVDLSRSPILGKPEIGYRAGAMVGPVMMADLPVKPELQAMGGLLGAKIDVQGNREDLTGKVIVTADGLRPTKLGAVALNATVGVNDADTDVDVRVRVSDTVEGDPASDLLKVAGKVGLGGKKLFATLKDKEHLDPTLALALDIPKRALASLKVLRPNLEKAPGNLTGSIPITGTAKMPLAKGAIAITDVARVDGKTGGAGISIDVNKDAIALLVGVGETNAADAPLKIAVNVPRDKVAGMSKGEVLPVTATIRANSADLRTLVPAQAMADTKVDLSGKLDWNMDVKASLAKDEKLGTQLKEGSITGLLDLKSDAIGLPGTKRAYRDIALTLKADDKGLHLDALRAKESDLDEKERTIAIKAEVGLDKFKPTSADVKLAANKWLVFGPRALGFADAPRGTLTLDATAKAELDKPLKKASLNVTKLDLLLPERFERAHQPEDVQVGDVFYLDEKKVAKGKLPVAPPPEAPKEEPKAVAAAGTPAAEEGFDVDIHVDNARLFRAPIDVHPKGDLKIAIRPSGRTTRGKLVVTGGQLQLGGKQHTAMNGSLTFDDEHPKGWLDLNFARQLKPSQLRDISEASGGDSVKVHMFGPITDYKTVLSGAGSPGALWDVLSMHNTGRERHISEPDLPGSMAIDFPQHDSLLVLSFLSVNLPHLLFLDRFGAWADPYDPSSAYGRLNHFEAERYVADDKVRVRATTRPPTAGESEAELEIDYLPLNTARMMFGIGAQGGTRGGGGPGFVWEWSSKD